MQDKADLLAQIIRARKTEKILTEINTQASIDPDIERQHQASIVAALQTAGWAPFHYPREIDGIAEPWRARILWRDQAQQAARYMTETLGITTKEPKLCSACHALVLVTWLPEYDANADNNLAAMSSEKIIKRNYEHLAAASAMVQNFLLMLTAHEMANYWSSGGCLGKDAMFDYLDIDSTERLLAAVFIEFPNTDTSATVEKERKPGAHRNRRSTSWIKVAD